MTAVQPFDFQGHQVRVVTDDHGEPWFFAIDACRVLEIKNTGDAMSRLATDEKGVGTADTPGGPQQVTTVSEAGLYRLVFTSRRPEAETFRRWVTHDVLPAIRRTGSYSTAPALPDLSTPTGVLEMAEQLLHTARALVEADARIAELEPVAEVAQRVLDADGDFSLREAAQALSRDHAIETGQNRLLASLRTLGWVDGNGRAYQRRIESGHLKVLARTYDHPHTGEPMLSTQLRVTGKGVVALASALRPTTSFPPLTAV